MLKYIIIVPILSIIVLTAAWQITTSQAGKKPTKAFVPPTSSHGKAENSSFSWKEEFKDFIGPLEEAYLAKRTDPEKIIAYAKGLETIISVKFIPEIVAELVLLNQELFSLDSKYKTAEALGKQADLFFGLKQFDQAEPVYIELLEKDPGNHDLRGRLASALSFQGRFDEAIKQLDMVLSEQPNNFHALAYMSITYAQMDKVEQALEYGSKALLKAPSEEAKQRLASFVREIQAKMSANDSSISQPLINRVSQLLRSNSVTTDKFIAAEIDKNTLKLTFENFPMEHMPDFAKDSFIANIKSAIVAEDNIKSIDFVDRKSNQVMFKKVLD